MKKPENILVRYKVNTWLVLGRYLVGTCRYSEYLLAPYSAPKARKQDRTILVRHGNVRYDNGISCRCVLTVPYRYFNVYIYIAQINIASHADRFVSQFAPY